jgi:Protein of unknown function (DUF3108)
MGLISVAIAAGGFLTLPLAGNGAISALLVQGPAHIEIDYEGIVPVPVLGRTKAASASVVMDLTQRNYDVTSNARAEGVVDWFVDYNLAIVSTGAITPYGVRPLRYDSANKDGNKNRRVIVEFSPAEVVVSVTPKYGDWGFPATTKSQMLEAADPLSAIVELTLRADATPGNPCGGPMRIFDGKQRYDMRLKLIQRVNFKSKAYTGPALICDLEYVEIAGFKSRSAEQRAKDRGDMKWSHLTLAELNGGTLTPPIKIEGRSKKRGKMTVQATRLAYTPVAR